MSVLAIIAEAAAFAALDFGIDAIKNAKEDPNGKTMVEIVVGSGSSGTEMVSSFEPCSFHHFILPPPPLFLFFLTQT